MVNGKLFDTNVLSELRRPSPAPQVKEFVTGCDSSERFVSVVTIAEIRYGIRIQPNYEKRVVLQSWLDDVIHPMFASGTLLEANENVLLRWRVLLESGKRIGRTFNPLDSLIAATALHYDLTLVTRNIRDFENMDLKLINPWSL